VGLTEASLVGEACAGEGATIYAPEEFEPKELMEVLEVH
jgi:hypothetical protein